MTRRLIILGALLLSGAPAFAQTPVAVKAIDSAAGTTTDVGDATNHALRVNIIAGAGSGGTASADRSTFTFGTTSVTPAGCAFDDTPPTALTTGMLGVFRCTANRAVHFNLRNASGTEMGTSANPLQVTGANGTFPVSGTVTANAGANLNTSSLFLDATYTGRMPAGASPANGESNTNTALSRVGGYNFIYNGSTWDRWTGAISGTVTTTPPANASTNVAQLAGTTTDTNSGTKSAGTLRVVLATDQPQLTNKLLVTPDSVALPANQSVNVNQINAATPLMGNGLTGTGSQRVTIASDNTAFAVNNTQQGTAAQNVTQFGGTNVSTGTGAGGAGIPRVTVSNDSSLAANQSVNVNQFGGSAVTTGVGAAGSGVPRVTVSDDNNESTGTVNSNGLTFPVSLAGRTGAGFALTAACTCTIAFEYSYDNGSTYLAALMVIGGVQSLTGVITNPAAAQDGHFIVGEHWTHVRARVTAYTSGTPVMWVHATKTISPLAVGALSAGLTVVGAAVPLWADVIGLKAQTGVPAAVTNGQTVNANGDVYGVPFAREDHPNRFSCTVAVSTATTITAVGGSCAAPGAALSLYVTDILFASNAQAIAADTFPTLKYGTNGTCGVGTTVFWGAFQTAATQATTVQSFKTPIKIPANNEICWINSTAGSKFLVITGFIAP